MLHWSELISYFLWKHLNYLKSTKDTGVLSDEIYECQNSAPFKIHFTHFMLAWQDTVMTR